MSIEEDMFNVFKYAGFSGGAKPIDPTKVIRALLKSIEISMLSQMDAQIRLRLNALRESEDAQQEALDPFAILGVTPQSTREEVDKAYRTKARAAHPDMGGSDIEMAKVNAAYEAIRIFKHWKEK